MNHDNDNNALRFLSVCSGIEAASVAWNPLGWQAVAFSEIEKFPSAVLAHHYPDVPNLGDFTKIDTSVLGRIDILCGGTPCQAFSIAGARRSLEDARGNLTLAFVELAHELAAGNGLRNVVWENVPGVLSTKDNAFGCFLAGLVGADDPLQSPDGHKWPNAGMVAGPRARAAWRILDAQYFGLAQRRRRVIVIADFGNGADPAAVLFERKSLSGNTPPSREAGKNIAPTISARPTGGGGLGTDFDLDGGVIQVFDRQSSSEYGTSDIASTLSAHDYKSTTDIITFESNMSMQSPSVGNVNPTLTRRTHAAVCDGLNLRRLTPTECERLQGFPDGYTNIPWRSKQISPDGPRYKALGNSWAVPKFRWVGERIERLMPKAANDNHCSNTLWPSA